MVPHDTPCPYVGLRPFREADVAFFFGRERDIRIISSNLLAQSLTVLYGASGVGKSSVLQAGVVPYLKNLPNSAVLYFNEWQNRSSVEELLQRCQDLVMPDVEWEDQSDALNKAARGQMFLLLDQFEEFLLYHGPEERGAVFDSALARIVNREDVTARVLLGIREDALSRFDQRFSIRIPNLLGNTLAVEHLDSAAARNAIEGPIGELNRQCGLAFQIEPGLVEDILHQVQAGKVSLSESTGIGVTEAGGVKGRIETAFLQLVLMRLWTEETRQNSMKLRAATLAQIGGAGQIVQVHVNHVMSQLASNTGRDIAARMFRYLVTPSRTKVAQATADLISFAEARDAEVKDVLISLTDKPDARIFRRLATPERYEIFHDVLAQPILDWRRNYLEAKERAAAEQERQVQLERQRRELEQAQKLAHSEQMRAEHQAQAARQLRWMLAAVVVALLVAISAAAVASRQSQRAREFAEIVILERRRAELAETEAKAAKSDAEARLAQVEAVRAEAAGKYQDAERLRTESQKYKDQAETLQKTAEEQKFRIHAADQAVYEAMESRKNYQDALQQFDSLRTQLSVKSKEAQDLRNERDQLKIQLDRAQSRTAPPDTAVVDSLRTQLSVKSKEAEDLRKERNQLKIHVDRAQEQTALADTAAIFVDAQTGLVWTKKDNNSDINWNEADQYCRNLTRGSYSRWRLPTIEELAKLVDPKTRKIRDPFQPSANWIWSSTKRGSGSAWVFFFGDYFHRTTFPVVVSIGHRALCVLRSGE